MIYCLVQSRSDLPWRLEGSVPPGVLSRAEQNHLDGLKTEKRRADWLLGRWTAKVLLQTVFQSKAGKFLPLNSFPITSREDGSPAFGAGEQAFGSLANLDISISHCDGSAVCALSSRPGWRVGVDMEVVSARPVGFVEEYYTYEEIAQVQAASQGRRDLRTTAIWCAKEAALKALRLGLSVDTRSLSCQLLQPTGSVDGWQPLMTQFQPQVQADTETLLGWWRTWDRFVLAVVLQPARFPG